MDHMPIKIDWLTTSIIIISGILAAVLASVWPILKASRIDPAEALRYE